MKPEIQRGIDIDLHDLKDAAQEYIDFIDSEDYNEDDEEAYQSEVFEKAMIALFGDDVFEWVNKRQE